jgi:hypothetical protein
VRIIFIWLVLAISLCSCNSATESKGIDAVLAFYGGKAVYSKGVVSSTKEKLQGRYYEIKLSGVEDRIKPYFTSFQLPASNCAYLFYHALAPTERDTYSFIRIILEGQNTASTYEFATHDLAKVEQAMVLVDNAVGYLRTADYDPLLGKGSSIAASKQDWAKAKTMFTAADQAYGPVTAFSLQGFEVVAHDLPGGAKRFVRAIGVLARKKQNTDFTFVLDPTANVQSAYWYGFSFSKKLSQ